MFIPTTMEYLTISFYAYIVKSWFRKMSLVWFCVFIGLPAFAVDSYVDSIKYKKYLKTMCSSRLCFLCHISSKSIQPFTLQTYEIIIHTSKLSNTINRSKIYNQNFWKEKHSLLNRNDHVAYSYHSWSLLL